MTASDWAAVGLSLRVAGAATLLALGPSLALGWFLAGRRGMLARGVEFVVFLPLVVPPVVTGYALLAVLPRTVAFTGLAAVLASAVVGLPLFVQLARVGFEGVRPDVLDAARVDGATAWALWRRVVVPLAAPSVAAGAALHFARGLGEFGATLVVAGNLPGRTQTLPLALYSRLQQVGGEAATVQLAFASVALAALSLGASRLIARRWRTPGAP
ncbi:molybdate ABC transporter permease subunit [Rubrivirga sp. IMCC43871]|uniref:molybdate ABC transporter permease subunit n=1 Tax=Rubrivirga sp. IMCC43871 TaxID=3391575 RepID=UPI0039903575